MKHIVLICAGGFSTNILATLVRKIMEDRGFDGDIKAMSEWDFHSYRKPVDIVLLAPQLSFAYEKLEKKYRGTRVRTAMISMDDYGKMDAEHVYEMILEMLKEEKEKQMSVQDKMTSFFDRLAPTINKLGNNIYLRSISNTMMGTIGPLMVGSVAVLFLAFPVQAVKDFIAAAGLTPILAAVNSVTIGGLALYVVFLMARNLITLMMPGEDGTLIGALALMSFLIITPLGTLEAGGSAIPTQWLGASGVFSAFIVGIVCAKIYELFIKKQIRIKMPESVPSVVTKSFDSLLPSFAIGAVFILIRLLFQNTSFGNMHQFIYSLIQAPLQGLGTSLPATLIFGTVAQLLWFFGIHGTNVINPLVQPLRLALDTENMAALAAGQALPNIIGNAFWSINTWGATTLGLILLMLFSKSKQYREMGKIALVPGILGITEPLVFGLPLVFNFSFFFPYIFNNVIIILLSYFLTSIGVIARCSGVQCIFGLPLGFHAMVGGHWTIVVWQIVCQLILSPILWYPWFKMAEKKKIQEEAEAENA